MDKISVVVPVYKTERYLCQCLDSITNQTYRDLEIILVDDGSPDDCGRICEDHAARDERIQVIHEANAGVSAARNAGMARSTGRWIAFVDSDDWLEADHFAQMLAAAGGHGPDVIFSGGWYDEGPIPKVRRTVLEPFELSGTDAGKEILAIKKRILTYQQPVAHLSPSGNVVLATDKLYSLAFLRRHRLCFHTDLTLGEDAYFNWQVFSHAEKVTGSTAIGYHYRATPDSAVHSYRPNAFHELLAPVEKLYADITNNKTDDDIPVEMLYGAALMSISGGLKGYVLHPDNHAGLREKKKELERMKSHPLVKAAIMAEDDSYLSGRQPALKRLLRLPWLWPLMVGWGVWSRLRTIVL